MCAQESAADISVISGEPVYRTTEVDSRPEIVDGMYTLPMFISKKLTLPEIHDRKVTIFIGFVVEKDSSLSDIKFIHLSAERLYSAVNDSVYVDLNFTESAVYEGLKEQAIAAVTEFDGKWIPAKKDGLPVRCQFNYPIVINIE